MGSLGYWVCLAILWILGYITKDVSAYYLIVILMFVDYRCDKLEHLIKGEVE